MPAASCAADGGGHGGHVAIGHDNALLRLPQHVRDAAGAVERDHRQPGAEGFQHNGGERVLAGGQRKRVGGGEHRVHVVAIARHTERSGSLGVGDLGAKPVFQAGVDAADPDQADAAAAFPCGDAGRAEQAPELKEQIEALAHIGVTHADHQLVALGQAEFGAQSGAGGRVVGDGLVAALRQNKGPVGRFDAQQLPAFRRAQKWRRRA